MIYTGKREPQLLAGESPGRGELGFKLPIRVKSNHKSLIMDEASRLHYAKVYTIEHNVKVFDFGMVDSEHVMLMQSQWEDVMGLNRPSQRDVQNTPSGMTRYPSSDGDYSGYGNTEFSSSGATTYAYPTASSSSYRISGGFYGSNNDQDTLESVDEDEDEDDDEDDEESEDRPSPYADYAVARGDYSPKKKDRKQGQIAIKENHRLGVFEVLTTGWVKVRNFDTGEDGLVWRQYIAIDSEVLAAQQLQQ